MKKFRGFTLVEFLIALSIVSVIAAASVVSFSSVNRIVDLQRGNDEMLREMRVFLEGLDREISGALYVRRDKGTVFFSQRREIAGKEVSFLLLTTLLPQEYLELGTRGEIVGVQYILEQNESDVELLVLKKRILYNTIGYDFRGGTADTRSLPSEISGVSEYNVREDFTLFQLRFYSDGKWHESWDSSKTDGLPESVELFFSLGGKKYRELFNVFISES
jgi:prepilin-type N-terminal cleavage/methylation domain-containing protein